MVVCVGGRVCGDAGLEMEECRCRCVIMGWEGDVSEWVRHCVALFHGRVACLRISTLRC